MDDVRIASQAKSTGPTSPSERARRKAAINYAGVSLRLEGFILDAAIEELNCRYSDGEITSAEHSAAIRASVGR